MNPQTTRNSSPADLEAIRRVHLLAFPESENERVARLALELCAETGTPPTLSLLAEQEGNVVGHVVFSPVEFVGAGEMQGYTLAPLGVVPGNRDAKRSRFPQSALCKAFLAVSLGVFGKTIISSFYIAGLEKWIWAPI